MGSLKQVPHVSQSEPRCKQLHLASMHSKKSNEMPSQLNPKKMGIIIIAFFKTEVTIRKKAAENASNKYQTISFYFRILFPYLLRLPYGTSATVSIHLSLLLAGPLQLGKDLQGAGLGAGLLPPGAQKSPGCFFYFNTSWISSVCFFCPLRIAGVVSTGLETLHLNTKVFHAFNATSRSAPNLLQSQIPDQSQE